MTLFKAKRQEDILSQLSEIVDSVPTLEIRKENENVQDPTVVNMSQAVVFTCDEDFNLLDVDKVQSHIVVKIPDSCFGFLSLYPGVRDLFKDNTPESTVDFLIPGFCSVYMEIEKDHIKDGLTREDLNIRKGDPILALSILKGSTFKTNIL